MRPFLFSVLAGWILVHQNGGPITTVGYYGTETRCNHAASSINAKRHGEAWCLPDDIELRDREGVQ